MVERAEISQVLAQIRSFQSQMPDGLRDVAPDTRIDPARLVQPQDDPGFSELFTQAIDQVREAQAESSRLREAYELGTPGVSLTEVMVAAEKSSVAFQAMNQVRNKLVEAYKEIMSMPV